MRTMWDALYPDRIPQGIPTDILIATYVHHPSNPTAYDQACKRFPLNQIVSEIMAQVTQCVGRK